MEKNRTLATPPSDTSQNSNWHVRESEMNTCRTYNARALPLHHF
jgi:hypothetical protein